MEKNQMPNGGSKKKYRRIGQKVGRIVAILEIVSLVLAVSVCVFLFSSLIRQMQEVRCTNGTNILARELSRVTEDQDMNQLLDELKSQMGCDFTIFEGDTRAYSTVIQNGQRTVGTQLSPELSAIVLQKGQSYVGESTIHGDRYLCSYVPTRGEDGKINGLIFAGLSMSDARRGTAIVIALACVISFVTILVSILFLAAYLKKRVSAPLSEITQVASRMEKGDLGLASGQEIVVSAHSDDEIGMLGTMFEDTIRRLQSYIGEITSVLDSIAHGNLTKSPVQDYLGDFHSIRLSLDSILENLNRTMGQINASANQVAAGSDQVASSSQALAQGATEQASSVEEISATIANLSRSSQQTTDTAKEVDWFVSQAGAHLGISMEYVKELNTAMENISSSSKKIGTIIATIENIAFQINILALNAAVEAARAGSAGKGFAVVADEVSNLASKSDAAAKATKELIDSSITAVTQGSEVVGKVTEALNQTGEYAGNVTTKMTVVVEEVEKQSMAMAQVTDGIDQISSVVQTNSATSQECAAASQELSSQAGLMKNLMRSFRLNS